MKKIKFVIESDLANVELIGLSVNSICSFIPLPEREIFQIELCVIEAVNNSIIHAYNCELIHQVEVIMSINEDSLIMEVLDKGKTMAFESLEKATIVPAYDSADNLEEFAESGRGLGLIKEFMDKVAYSSDKTANSFKMIKYFNPDFIKMEEAVI